jgi:hypothetical protein
VCFSVEFQGHPGIWPRHDFLRNANLWLSFP